MEGAMAVWLVRPGGHGEQEWIALESWIILIADAAHLRAKAGP
jgi:hypothetical protein